MFCSQSFSYSLADDGTGQATAGDCSLTAVLHFFSSSLCREAVGSYISAKGLGTCERFMAMQCAVVT